MTWLPPTTLSPSKMSTFLKCPLSYYFQYLCDVERKQTVATLAGTTVHSALEELMKLPQGERTPEACSEFTETAIAEAVVSKDFLAIEEEKRKGFEASVRRGSSRFFDMTDPNEVKVRSTELRLEVEWDDITLVGIIDLFVDGPDGLEVWDHKNGRSPSERFQRQTLQGVQFYALMVREHLGEIPTHIRLLYLQDRLTITAEPTQRSVSATEAKVRAVLDAMQRAHETDDFRPKTSALCGNCDFQAHCPAHGGSPDAIPVRVELRS